MKTTSYISTFLVGAALAVTPALAQTSGSQTGSAASSGNMSATSTSNGNLASTDKKFIKSAAEGGIAEVELGHLAVQKAASEDVKKFGQRMVDDHSKANDELKQVASSKGVDLPTDLSAKDKMLKERLSRMNGQDFDKAYMQNMVKDHRKDVAEFQKESSNGSDPDVKQFASKTLPKLQEHLQSAESIAPNAKSNGGTQ